MYMRNDNGQISPNFEPEKTFFRKTLRFLLDFLCSRGIFNTALRFAIKATGAGETMNNTHTPDPRFAKERDAQLLEREERTEIFLLIFAPELEVAA